MYLLRISVHESTNILVYSGYIPQILVCTKVAICIKHRGMVIEFDLVCRGILVSEKALLVNLEAGIQPLMIRVAFERRL